MMYTRYDQAAELVVGINRKYEKYYSEENSKKADEDSRQEYQPPGKFQSVWSVSSRAGIVWIRAGFNRALFLSRDRLRNWHTRSVHAWRTLTCGYLFLALTYCNQLSSQNVDR